MKILFYDGDIRQWCRPATIRHHHTIDAAHGPSDNIEQCDCILLIDAAHGPSDNAKQLEWACLNYCDCILLTNSLVTLDHKYGWNNEENHTDIYFYVESKHDFVRCDELTEREVRRGHNIMKMFMNGAFDLEQNDAKSDF